MDFSGDSPGYIADGNLALQYMGLLQYDPYIVLYDRSGMSFRSMRPSNAKLIAMQEVRLTSTLPALM